MVTLEGIVRKKHTDSRASNRKPSILVHFAQERAGVVPIISLAIILASLLFDEGIPAPEREAGLRSCLNSHLPDLIGVTGNYSKTDSLRLIVLGAGLDDFFDGLYFMGSGADAAVHAPITRHFSNIAELNRALSRQYPGTKRRIGAFQLSYKLCTTGIFKKTGLDYDGIEEVSSYNS